MDKFKEMILNGIEKGVVEYVANCVASVAGWYKQTKDKTVPVDFLNLAESGKIVF